MDGADFYRDANLSFPFGDAIRNIPRAIRRGFISSLIIERIDIQPHRGHVNYNKDFILLIRRRHVKRERDHIGHVLLTCSP